jgi:ribosomal protein S14
MPTLPLDVRLDYEQKTGHGTLYYECRRCGRRTKTYRKIKRHLRSCRT